MTRSIKKVPTRVRLLSMETFVLTHFWSQTQLATRTTDGRQLFFSSRGCCYRWSICFFLSLIMMSLSQWHNNEYLSQWHDGAPPKKSMWCRGEQRTCRNLGQLNLDLDFAGHLCPNLRNNCKVLLSLHRNFPWHLSHCGMHRADVATFLRRCTSGYPKGCRVGLQPGSNQETRRNR